MPRAATLIQRALRAVGLEVRRLRRGAPPPFAPLVLSRHLEGVDVVLDVGANVGQFGRQVRQHGYTGRIVSFEPQHDAYRELCAAAAGDDAWECVEVALGEREGELTLHIAGNSKASSLLEMTSVHVDVAPTSGYIGEQPTVVRPLDALDVLDPASGCV